MAHASAIPPLMASTMTKNNAIFICNYHHYNPFDCFILLVAGAWTMRPYRGLFLNPKLEDIIKLLHGSYNNHKTR